MNELEALIDEMATKYKDDKKTDLDGAKEQLREKMAAAKSKMHGTTVSPSCVRRRCVASNQLVTRAPGRHA